MSRVVAWMLAFSLGASGCRLRPDAESCAATPSLSDAAQQAKVVPSQTAVDVDAQPIALPPLPEPTHEEVRQVSFDEDVAVLPPGVLSTPAPLMNPGRPAGGRLSGVEPLSRGSLAAQPSITNPALVGAEVDGLPLEVIPMPAGDASPATLEDVITSVYASYPAIDAATRERQIAAGKQLAAEGKFDNNLVGEAISEPLGFYRNNRFTLGVKQYTWGGAETFAGYRLGRGLFEPWYLERDTNQGGEFKAGFVLPFLRNRDIDKRRAAVFKSQIDRMAVEPVVQLEIIDAVRSASFAYWDWLAAGQKARIASHLLELAVDRQTGLEKRAALGDLAGIELVDNQRLIVSRQAKRIDAERKLNQAAAKLSLFFRDSAGTPLLVSAEQLPDDFPTLMPLDRASDATEINQALARRPEVRLLQLEREQAEVELQQASNLMLPSIDGVMTASQDMGYPTSQIRDKSQFELEAGALIEVPLQRSEARGKVQAAQGKLAQISAKRRLVEQKIAVEVRNAQIALVADYAAWQQARQSVELAMRMEEAEIKKFDQGASDLLIVNLREQATADAEALAVDAAANYFMAQAQLRAAVAGELTSAPQTSLPTD